MNKQNLAFLFSLYEEYIYTVKALIAEVELKYESFPLSIFNEIRSFNDHIARCVDKGMT